MDLNHWKYKRKTLDAVDLLLTYMFKMKEKSYSKKQKIH